MSEDMDGHIDELEKIIRILADVWPADRDQIAVAGAAFEEAVDGVGSGTGQLQRLIDLAWDGLKHLFEQDDLFISVKTATMQGVNTIREFLLWDGDIPVDDFEKACRDLKEALEGGRESVKEGMDRDVSDGDLSGGVVDGVGDGDLSGGVVDEGVGDIDLSGEGVGDEDLEKKKLHIPEDTDRTLIDEYVTECSDMIESGEYALLKLEESPDNPGLIKEIFRTFHTIKGTSAFIGLQPVTSLTHLIETKLEEIRDGEIEFRESCPDVILEAIDLIRQIHDLVAAADAGETLPLPAGYHPLMNRLARESVAGKSATGKSSAGEDEDAGDKTTSQPEPGPQNRPVPSDPSSVQNEKAIRSQSKTPNKQESEKTIRVNLQRLDQLIDLVGELVIAHSVEKHDEEHSRVRKILRELQDMSLSLRMVPLRTTFYRMNRLVRDLARSAGKQVTFSTAGEDTEIDRNMVDLIQDPLIHLLRNAIDHGIEGPQERERSGKPDVASICLRAFQEGGKVVIEVEDDGRGINRKRIHELAISRGLIDPDISLSDREICRLVLLPGFSSAAKVTDLSGRGVGMDVVKESINRLNGTVEISSEEGSGTTFSLKLPFTMAVIDGMVVGVGDQRFIIPVLDIESLLRPAMDEIFTVMGQSEQVTFRGQSIPVIRLHQKLHIPDARKHLTDGTLLVIRRDHQLYALFVDKVIEQKQLVGKSVDLNEEMGYVSGGAILGDGQVGLILDAKALVSQ